MRKKADTIIEGVFAEAEAALGEQPGVMPEADEPRAGEAIGLDVGPEAGQWPGLTSS